ncbi:hypothetical protein JOC55_000562 [Paenibacillus sacheonensis]|nr:hypothetical protein [Paenibacillus sacheonensis]
MKWHFMMDCIDNGTGGGWQWTKDKDHKNHRA